MKLPHWLKCDWSKWYPIQLEITINNKYKDTSVVTQSDGLKRTCKICGDVQRKVLK